MRQSYPGLNAPVKKMPRRNRFQLLVTGVLSTRTQDPVTVTAARRLLCRAPDPKALARLRPETVERLIFPVGFYRTKAQLLPRLARMLIANWQGRVPDRFEELVTLPGVGRKVANIVLSQGFGRPAIAVDSHVHRISNRMGLVRTSTPEQTEKELLRVLPKRFWSEWNRLLVALGQTICRPRRPLCSECPIFGLCRRQGVEPSQSRLKRTR
ncbi:MAG: endonuclease III [candidate division WOR-3 bacterium]